MIAIRQVLLVEDEPLVASLVTDILGDFGYGVIGATTARAALEFAADGIGAFEFAIVDLGLPDRNGADLVVDLRVRRSDLPIIVATGYDDDRSHLGEMTRLALIRKPYSSDQLKAAIDAVIAA